MLKDLTVIIPTMGPTAGLARLIGQVAGAGEVIVSLGGDAWEGVPLPDYVRLVTGPAGRGGQLGRGAAAATKGHYLFLHADSQLDPDWQLPVSAALARADRAAVFRLRFDSPGIAPRLVAGWANLRSRAGLPYGDQGLLMSAALYAKVGGFPDIPLMEDVAIARALKGRIDVMPMALNTSGAKYERDGWVRRGAGNLWTLLRYLMGADPAALAREYRRRDQS